MRAVVKYGHGDGEVELREVDRPVLEPHEVLIAVKAVGVCGTDIDLYHNKQTYKVGVPVILGHEFTGEIAEVGSDVVGWQVGDRVVSETAARICGTCSFCRAGKYNFCPERKGFGYGVDGAFADFVKTRAGTLHRVPDSLDYEQAVLIEPVTVTVNALTADIRIYPGDTVAIIGPGTVGLLTVKMACIAGARNVVMIGRSRHQRRFQMARDLGATETIDSESEDAVARMRAIGDGLGADVVVDVSGSSETLDLALDIVRPIGWGAKPLGFSLARLVSKAIRLQGVYSHTSRSWERAISLVSSGQFDAGSIIGGYYPLDEWRRAIEDSDSGKVVKAVITP